MPTPKVNVSLQVSPELHGRARAMASELGCSVSEVVRRALDAALTPPMAKTTTTTTTTTPRVDTPPTTVT